MTVIALLNAEQEPHIVADTLITADGKDPNVNQRIWLPAVGAWPSQYGTEANPWYIARLGRKTFALPNGSGMLAFAGNCRDAFEFWSELSAKIINAAGYCSEQRVDEVMVNQALASIGGQHISLLGVLIDENGKHRPFVHNATITVQTKNLGTCYVAGSGTSIVHELIRKFDDVLPAKRTDDKVYRMGPTEDLAEGIAAQLMYAEGSADNGHAGTSIDFRCGGFYEWYQVKQKGVLHLQPRLDLHLVEAVDGRLLATRIYHSDLFEENNAPHLPVPTREYKVVLLNLGLSPTPMEHSTDGWLLAPRESYGTAIESTFKLYDAHGGTGRAHGPGSSALLTKLYGVPLEVRRLRLIVSRSSGAIMRSISRRKGEIGVPATISYMNDQLRILLSDEVIDSAKEALAKLN